MSEPSPLAGHGPSALELEIRGLCDRGEWDRAATVLIHGYGPELLNFLHAGAPGRPEAEDMFAELSERMWRKLPQFAWRSSCRSWAYVLARNLACDHRRHREMRSRRLVPLSEAPVSAIVAAIRSTIDRVPAATDPRLELVRSLLDDDERMLLVLRVERRMSWPEIARIVDGEREASPAELDEAELARVAARLRKQFERIKERLRKGLSPQAP